MRLHRVYHHFPKAFPLSSTPHSLSTKPPILPSFPLIRPHSTASATIRPSRFRNQSGRGAAVADSCSSAEATAFEDSSSGNGYRLPPPEIRDIVDAPPLPMLSFSPLRDKIMFLRGDLCPLWQNWQDRS